MQYTTILLPLGGPISGACRTSTVQANSPRDAAARELSRAEEGRVCLVVDGEYTHAFRALEVRRVEVTEA